MFLAEPLSKFLRCGTLTLKLPPKIKCKFKYHSKNGKAEKEAAGPLQFEPLSFVAS